MRVWGGYYQEEQRDAYETVIIDYDFKTVVWYSNGMWHINSDDYNLYEYSYGSLDAVLDQVEAR